MLLFLVMLLQFFLVDIFLATFSGLHNGVRFEVSLARRLHRDGTDSPPNRVAVYWPDTNIFKSTSKIREIYDAYVCVTGKLPTHKQISQYFML